MSFKKSIKVILTIFIFSLLPFVAVKAIAFDPEEIWFGNVQETNDRDVTETDENVWHTDLGRMPIRIATNSVWREYLGCTPQYSEEFNANVQQAVNGLVEESTDEGICDNINNQYRAGLYKPNSLAGTRVGGSILGVAYFFENTLENEPIPVNYAYFFREYGRKIPVVGERVFAADSIDYGHELVNLVIDIWKISRNVAYALMAIILLYVGFTIITRKKLDPRMVVTVQYALPKVVLALILIAFSYPIGAFLTSLAWSMFYNADTIVYGLNSALGGQDVTVLLKESVSIGSILALAVVLGFANVGAGLFLGVILGVISFLVIALDLMVKFKAFMLFIKMLIRIVTSPVEFAISAIPGNEAKITDWFKGMAALGFGIVGIKVSMALIHMMGYLIINSADSFFYGAIFNTFGVFFVYIFGYTFALGIPGKIDKWIMGPKRR